MTPFQYIMCINNRGLPIDIQLCKRAALLVQHIKEKNNAVVYDITKLKITQTVKLTQWVNSRYSKVENFQARTLEKIDYKELDELGLIDVATVLQCKTQSAGTAADKFSKLVNATSRDRRIRGTLRYHGAHTGRLSGQVFQPHNLMRPKISGVNDTISMIKKGVTLEELELIYDNPLKALSSCVRGAIFSPDIGLLVADYVGIEAVILAWFSECKIAQREIESGVDRYVKMAARIYNVSEESVTPEQRRLGKAAILGCGYGMGASKFLQIALDEYHVNITEELAKKSVDTFRSTYQEIVELWRELERVAKKTVMTNSHQVFRGLELNMRQGFLVFTLLSGRKIYYPECAIAQTRYGPGLTYLKKVTKFKHAQCSTWGGELVENVIQAISYDILYVGMQNAERKNIKIIGSVHDEIIAENSETDVHEFEQLICDIPEKIYRGLSLRAEGYRANRYRK